VVQPGIAGFRICGRNPLGSSGKRGRGTGSRKPLREGRFEIALHPRTLVPIGDHTTRTRVRQALFFDCRLIGSS